jgi:hypothetical protein
MCRVTPKDKNITIMGLHEVNIGSILIIPHKVIVGFLFSMAKIKKWKNCSKNGKTYLKYETSCAGRIQD